MKLILPLQNEPTEELVRNHRGLQKLLGNASLLVQALLNEIWNRQKTA